MALVAVLSVTNAKSSAESEKFTLNIKSEWKIVFTNGCHFPPNSTNSETLIWQGLIYEKVYFVRC